jgi:hypothetical protein
MSEVLKPDFMELLAALVHPCPDPNRPIEHAAGDLKMTTEVQASKNEIEPYVKEDFFTALAAQGRSPEIPESSDLYGWLVGGWELDVLRYRVDVSEQRLKGEVHFAWVLEGRAMQDVWIMPPRRERSGPPDKMGNMYGTTLRVWDAALEAWRVTWINGVTGMHDELIGRASGKDIVQIGTHANGTPIRWIFTEITRDSFRWTGEALEADGKTWRLEGEFRAKRKAPAT